MLADDTTELGGEIGMLKNRWSCHNNHIFAEGYSSVEVFACHAMLTEALVWSMVPCMAPWDIAYNKCYDVVRYGWKLIALVRRRILRFAHCGTPCQSQTLARAPALRSIEEPLGKRNLKPHQQKLVACGNALSCFTVWLCIELMNAFSYFVIENPDQSYLWIAPLILELYALKGVGFIGFVMRAYG